MHTDYTEPTNSSRRMRVSYVIIDDGGRLYSCYMAQFLKWVRG